MFIWCAILFVLGILAFVDSLLNMGEIFRQVNSVLFMLLSLALLFRTTSKMKQHKKEHYEERIFHLEQQVKMLQAGREKLKDY
jgi:Zn-dependent membrane protease YugP